MGSDKLKSMLQASKEATKIVKEGFNRNAQPNSSFGGRITDKNYDVKMAELDNLVFGPYDKSLEENSGSSYSAEEEMKRINERQNKQIEINSKLPKNILQEIINNPCNFDTSIVTQDPRMAQLEEKLQKNNKQRPNGFDKVFQINDTLDGLDEAKKPVTENNNTSIDYSLIKTIVESVVDEKLSKYTQTLLTEGRNISTKQLSTIMLGENFRFIDNEGNVYECSGLKYKGKARMKNKK